MTVMRVLARYPDKSDVEIAHICSVSHTHVANLKKRTAPGTSGAPGKAKDTAIIKTPAV